MAGIVIAVVAIVGLALSTSSVQTSSTESGSPGSGSGSGPVNVTLVKVSSPDNACGLNGAVAGAFSTASYSTHTVFWWLPLNGTTVPCEVQNLTSSTPGFSLWGNYPLNVTSDQTPLIVNIGTPAAYYGVLSITVH